MSVNVLYRTSATAAGGRDGKARSEDGKVDVQLSTPKELGGAGGPGTNPEQLFAAGYSACFLGALKVAAQQLKTKVPAETSINATVGIGPRSEGGFGITADLGLQADSKLLDCRQVSNAVLWRCCAFTPFFSSRPVIFRILRGENFPG